MTHKTFRDYGIDLPDSATGQHYTTCPQCSRERKKSNIKCLGINVDKGLWHCSHCNWSGSLYQKEEAKININWQPNQKLPEKVLEYFARRGISEETLKRNDIQYHNDVFFPQENKKLGAICFPYFKDGKVVNKKYRSAEKKFIQEKGGERIFYGYDGITENETTLIITEGEIDKLSFDEISYKFSVSVPDGAPSPNAKNFNSKFDYLENNKSIIDRMDKVILAVDNDEPGRVLERELARRIGIEKCYRVEYPKGCKDPNDVLVKHGKQALIDLIGSAKPFPILGVSTVEDLHQDLIDLYKNGVKKVYSTGWITLDEYYHVRPGELSVVTGYPGHGKSEFMDALLLNLAIQYDWNFSICSLENLPYERYLIKMTEKFIGKPFFAGPNKRMDEEELSNAESFLNEHFYLINPEQVEIDYILSIAKSLIYRHGINGLIIDPYNELDHKRPIGMSETEYISQFLSKVRRFAKLNNIGIWVVAHPVKPPIENRDKPPTIYDISGSANWANKSDNALAIFRHAYDDTVEIHIQKIRFKEVGKIGTVELKYDRMCGRYFEK